GPNCWSSIAPRSSHGASGWPGATYACCADARSPADATIRSMREATSLAAPSIAAACRRAVKTKKPPMTAAAMSTAATINRFVRFCIANRIADKTRLELHVRLKEESILLRPRGRGVIVHPLVGEDEADAAARPHEPVGAA